MQKPINPISVLFYLVAGVCGILACIICAIIAVNVDPFLLLPLVFCGFVIALILIGRFTS